jgi:drug/metabolite transporter (DMT)-like permease
MTTVAGSALLSISIAFNAMSLHGTCTAVFVAVATIIVFLLASIQTLDKVAWITWAGALSLVVSLFLVTIAVGVTDRPAAAPATGPFDKDFRITSAPTFAAAMSAVSQLSFAYAGTPA